MEGEGGVLGGGGGYGPFKNISLISSRSFHPRWAKIGEPGEKTT